MASRIAPAEADNEVRGGATLRDVGGFEQIARRFTLIIRRGEKREEREAWLLHIPVCTVLTPVESLESQFPKSDRGTPYHLISRATEPMRGIVVIVDHQSEVSRVYREVALGMMDNPVIWR